MILNLIVIGFVIGLILPPRWRWLAAVVLIASAAWAVLIAVEIDHSPGVVAGAFGIAALNTAVGLAVGALIRLGFSRLFRKRTVQAADAGAKGPVG